MCVCVCLCVWVCVCVCVCEREIEIKGGQEKRKRGDVELYVWALRLMQFLESVFVNICYPYLK